MSQQDKTIPLATAITWTSDWRTKNPSTCRAFLIPIEDLRGVLAEIEAQPNPNNEELYARAYLAIDKTQLNPQLQEKLVIVGTKPEQVTVSGSTSTVYRDLLPSAAGSNVEDSGNNIYDFTKPCPTYCDDNSPLN